jgi:hypothetical protein
MNGKIAVMVGGGLLIVSTAGLALFNPTLTDYRQTVLTASANEEAERSASADRRAIEQEATRLTQVFAAVGYNPTKLDAGRIQYHHPILGASLINHEGSKTRTLTENLALSKEQALRRVAATQEIMRYGILVKLDAHTTRHSYGLWSLYSTCLDKKKLSYTGIAGRFYERPVDCSHTGR